MPKFKVDVVVTTNANDKTMNNVDRLQGEPFIIDTPGEFEIKDFFISVLPSNGQTLLVIETENMTLGHIGVLDRILTDTELEQLEGIDILCLPVTGMSKKTRSELIAQIEPRIIIPMNFRAGKLGAPFESIETFAKEMGIKTLSLEKKLLLKRKDLPAEETKIFALDLV